MEEVAMNALWPELTSLLNLFDAADRAAEGKKARPDVAAFRANLEPELYRLHRQLIDGSYRPGPYHTFRIVDPKPRLISAAPFRDRVVHHALTNIVEPIFELRFIPYSFACRAGFGTHKALAHARRACARYSCVLKLDVQKYFPSIDHQILEDLLACVIHCPDTLRLIELISASSNPQEEVLHYFPGDTLFTPHERRRGLPLGNQTSQCFANVYLNPMDHMIVRNLRPGAYARYVDDFCFPTAKSTCAKCMAGFASSSTAFVSRCIRVRAVFTGVATVSRSSAFGCYPRTRAWLGRTGSVSGGGSAGFTRTITRDSSTWKR
jgi:retron-type reverse transcriptase